MFPLTAACSGSAAACQKWAINGSTAGRTDTVNSSTPVLLIWLLTPNIFCWLQIFFTQIQKQFLSNNRHLHPSQFAGKRQHLKNNRLAIKKYVIYVVATSSDQLQSEKDLFRLSVHTQIQQFCETDFCKYLQLCLDAFSVIFINLLKYDRFVYVI